MVEIGYEYGDMEIKFHNKNLKYNLSNEIGFKGTESIIVIIIIWILLLKIILIKQQIIW